MRSKGRNCGLKRSLISDGEILTLVQDLTGIVPVGNLGRETPLDFTSLDRLRASLLHRELFSKYDDFKQSPEKEATTWKRFQEAEDLCRKTNWSFPRLLRKDPFWWSVRERIRRALGRLNWQAVARGMDHGPGGTTRLPRRFGAQAYKYSGQPETTSGNVALSVAAIVGTPLWFQSVASCDEGSKLRVIEVDGNHVLKVPKNYKTDRTIAKEPCMNVFVQKGLGNVIRHRLRSVGVFLNDQTVNQRSAQLGSINGQLATIDLSMASDTVSAMVIRRLFPSDWVEAFEQCRSPVGRLPSGETRVYQKFSSMGNGYTFEVESLLFWAICQTCVTWNCDEVDTSIRVYGDDLVVPSTICGPLLTRLQQAGFKPNVDKTWVEGPYRESCGKHYYLGEDVSPFYVRRPVRKLTDLFLLHNNLRRWLWARGDLGDCEALKKLRKLAPPAWREPRLPDGFGDGAFIGAIDQLRLDSHPRGWEGWQVSVLAVSQRQLADDLPPGQLVASLRSLARSRADRFGFRESTSVRPVRDGKVSRSTVFIPKT